jgi:glycosyltransferase involved in cell wall biosynthesis
MKKILYISYDGMTDPLGQSQVLPYLVALSKHGYRFTILSFEKPARYQKEKDIITAITKAAGITWVPQMFTKNPPILSKIYDRWRLKRKTFSLFAKEHFDMLHCRSYIASEMGLYLRKKKGVKFLFDMRGFWADEKVDSGQWNQSRWFYRRVYKHYKRKEKEFLLQADGIVTLTHAARNELRKNDLYRNLLIDVIPCCADLDHFNYQDIHIDRKVVLLKKSGFAPGSKIISYLGSVGGWYMTKEMFTFFNRLMKKRSEFVMMILTKDDPELVKKQARDCGIPDSKLVVLYATRNELPGYISLSDCSIFFIRPTYSKIASSPTKHAELMGMGVPVICNDIGDTGHVIEETRSGLVVKDFSVEAYDKAIDGMDELLAIPREDIRRGAMRFFDLEKGAGDYLQLYKRIFSE